MARRLIVCFDGTWNTPDNDADISEQVETNARRVYEAVADSGSDGKKQIKWYDKGVGTKWYDRVRGGAFGLGLSKNIREGYEFLAKHHEEGDEIFLFGFSRGSYTARSLVGLIRNCGLLRKEQLSQIDTAYEIYRTRDEGPDSEAARFFREQYSRDVKITFLGVWDTVGALGIPLKSFQWFNHSLYEFHDTELSAIVENAYHAVAVDEHRKEYNVTLWDPKAKPKQNVEQRWFLGAHADVGGGYENRTLSDIALLWMTNKAEICGLKFISDRLPQDVEENFSGKMTDSFQKFLGGFYGIFNSRHFRTFGGTTFGNEMLDETVKRRFEIDPNYRPKNQGISQELE